MKKIIAAVLVLGMMLSILPAQAFAAQTSEAKEEVIYISLKADGSVEEIYVVNIFDMKEGGTIVDYGDYASLRNMTGSEAIDYQDGKVTIQAGAGKIYYEGKLNSTEMPWNISVRYFMDGKEYSAQEIAGMDGALKIAIDITRNSESLDTFFDSFALQLSLTLDTEKCKDIVARDATIANVGSSKQLTHTILPGRGASLEITANVVDFTMDGISINAIPLNLNVEVDDDALLEQVDELLDALEKLDDGANSLKDGISSLHNGASSDLSNGVDSIYSGAKELEAGALRLQNGGTTLQTGAKDLQTATATLSSGMQALNDGIVKIQNALDTLNKESGTLNTGSAAFRDALVQLQTVLNGLSVTNEDLTALTDASAQILAGITSIANGASTLQQNVSFAALKAIMAERGLDVDNLQQSNLLAMELIRRAIEANRETAESLGYGALFGMLEQVITLLGANNAFIDGTGSYLDAVNSNMAGLTDGAAQLQGLYQQFDAEIGKIATLLGSLATNMAQLTGAVNTLVTEYGKLHNGIAAYTGAVAEIAAGYTEVVNGAAQLTSGSAELSRGATSLYDGAGTLLSGITELYNGAAAMKNGSYQLDSGVTELIRGTAALLDGSTQMAEGTAMLLEECDGIDDTITGKIDELLSGITGNAEEITSFVSDRNTEVESVQFVIKTEGVQMDTAVVEHENNAEPMNFWQKLLKLFGF